ncbi:hypothetical protein PTNB85_08603 [Pyrenophora teres f. teres]|nr:hypothetical protein HRS9139_09227 [Pyrenophora teres f. teres]KAE8827250.1 hypothetical protein PTNB85_08603 [Pyrenophora teres f. teres]KAE8831454.1 hypothetical protein HRS9122_09044 [Pyrenophora teres f. teres]CAA9966077.1 hypothetical protein PTMSG1_09436 [Pyrenophora teres f. maculata]
MLRSYDTRCLVYDTSHELNIRFRTSPLQDFSYSHLQHLTIDMGLLPRFSFSDRSASTMPQLKSLTLLRLHPYSHYEVANYTALKLLASAEPEELVLTSYSSSYFDIEQLYYHLSPFSYRNTPLLLVALRQTEIRLAHNHDDRSPLLGGFSANFRIQELEFNDVEWSRFVGRQSEREARGLVETGWDVIPGLCSIADTVHVRQGIRESRFLQRPGWAVEIEGGDTSDEDESEYEATEPDEMGQDNGGNALTVSNDDSE